MNPRLPKALRMSVAFVLFVSAVGAGVFALVSRKPFWRQWREHGAEPLPESAALLSYRHLGLDPEGGQAVTGAPPLGQYTVEVAAYPDRAQAEAQVAALAAQGVKAYFTPLHGKGRVLYRVRVGLYASQAEAEAARQAMGERIPSRGVGRL